MTQIPFIGLTGSIASGKSEALAALGRLGAATLSSDAVVHDLIGSEHVRDLLVERWGEEVAPGQAVDRQRVGAIVFERPEDLAWLEATLHPLVGERIAAWRAALPPGTRVAVVEVPLLFETDLEPLFDATIAVVAPDSLRAERAARRGTLALEGREQRQLPQDQKAARATHVVTNDASIPDLERALAAVLTQIAADREGDA